MKTTSHVLELQFKDELGKATKISIKNPTQGVNADTAKASLETISQQKVFRGKNGLFFLGLFICFHLLSKVSRSAYFDLNASQVLPFFWVTFGVKVSR